MTPETINAVKEAMLPVAEKIGQGAEYGWDVLVAGQYAEGVAMLVINLAILIFFIGGGAIAAHKINATLDEWDKGTPWFIWGIASIFVSIIPFVNLYEAMIKLISPEYAALKFLISLGQ